MCFASDVEHEAADKDSGKQSVRVEAVSRDAEVGIAAEISCSRSAFAFLLVVVQSCTK